MRLLYDDGWVFSFYEAPMQNVNFFYITERRVLCFELKK